MHFGHSAGNAEREDLAGEEKGCGRAKLYWTDALWAESELSIPALRIIRRVIGIDGWLSESDGFLGDEEFGLQMRATAGN